MAQVQRATSLKGKRYSTSVISVLSSNTGDWQELGYFDIDGSEGSVFRQNIDFNIHIPDGFVINSAFVTIEHMPSYITNLPDYSYIGNPTDEWRYCRNVKLYKLELARQYLQYGFPGEYSESEGGDTTEVTNAFGADGFTATEPSQDPPNVTDDVCETFTSIDIKSYLTVGAVNLFRLQSSDDKPNDEDEFKEIYKQTGNVIATITVVGYQK